jgi:uncharacterized protein (TIGR03435 family)
MLQTLPVDRVARPSARTQGDGSLPARGIQRMDQELEVTKENSATQFSDEVVFERVSMGTLAGTLPRSMDRSVIDATGLTGLWNVALRWADDSRPKANPTAATPGGK